MPELPEYLTRTSVNRYIDETQRAVHARYLRDFINKVGQALFTDASTAFQVITGEMTEYGVRFTTPDDRRGVIAATKRLVEALQPENQITTFMRVTEITDPIVAQQALGLLGSLE